MVPCLSTCDEMYSYATRFIPSRVEVTKQASAKAYIAVSSSKGTDLCM